MTQLVCPTCGLDLHPNSFGRTLICPNGHGYTQHAAEVNQPPTKKTSPPKK
jgi:hypothetical protein